MSKNTIWVVVIAIIVVAGAGMYALAQRSEHASDAAMMDDNDAMMEGGSAMEDDAMMDDGSSMEKGDAMTGSTTMEAEGDAMVNTETQ